MAGPHAHSIHSAGGKAGGKALMASPHSHAFHSKGGKVGGLQADPAKQLPGGPCKCGRTVVRSGHAVQCMQQGSPQREEAQGAAG